MNGDVTSLIVALKGATDLEKDGRIIVFGLGANLDTIRGLVAEKLGILTGYAEIMLLDRAGGLLHSIDQARVQQVIYCDLKQQLKSHIPGPRCLPFVGSIYEFLPNMTEGWLRQFEIHGPIVKAVFLGRRMIATNDPTIAEAIVKESDNFTKIISSAPVLSEIKNFGQQGLFTTDTDDPDWKLAHKLLMPAFSPRAIKAYQVDMGIITQQTIRVLGQYTPDEPVNILDWTTRLTFETIGRVGFGYDFGLLEERDSPPHPFIVAMDYCMKQVLVRARQTLFTRFWSTEANRRFDCEISLMQSTVDGVIRERKQGPDAADREKDLLGFMLNARDENDLQLSDTNIRDQVVTFLVAGHDTTANTLAWTLYELSQHPDVEAKVLQEIADSGITHDVQPSKDQISRLKYMHQVLKEVLRMYPPVRILAKCSRRDCVLPGGYVIEAGTSVMVHLFGLHYNPNIYPDPTRFDPDRWTPEEEQKRSRFAWLPFSTGPRGCIGMAFALQEAKTVLSMFLHRFKFCYDGPSVSMDHKTLTTKPLDLLMTVHPRTSFPSVSSGLGEQVCETTSTQAAPSLPQVASTLQETQVVLPAITFLYGTQTGTAQDCASQLAQQARSFGFNNVTLCEMDRWQVLQSGRYEGPIDSRDTSADLIVICASTYNGQPPDSAEAFNLFLDNRSKTSDKPLNGLLYCVFGVGNKNWRTYQSFPRKIDASLDVLGAERFFAPGEGNTDMDMDAAFNLWQVKSAHFWTHTLSYYKIAITAEHSIMPVSVGNTTRVAFNWVSPDNSQKCNLAHKNVPSATWATLLVNRELQHPTSSRSTRHIELDIFALALYDAKGASRYHAGDHLEIMPENDTRIAEAVALRFGWALDAVFEIDPDSATTALPRSMAAVIQGPCTVRNALRYYADLSSPPTRSMLGCFAAQLRTYEPTMAATFEALIMPDDDHQDYYSAFVKQHRTLLDLQLAYPQVDQLDLGQFLATMGVMQPRRYSIASSPLVHPTTAHLAVSVVDDVVLDNSGDERHYSGLATSYLSRSKEGSRLRAALKSSKDTFCLPSDPSVPMILIAAGTGLAPFRGFLQERAQQHAADRAPILLFFGCRQRAMDYIYETELEEHLANGVLTELHVAFSRETPPTPAKYVQHQLLTHATKVWHLLNKQASIFVCGSGAMSKSVRQTFCNMAKTFGQAETEAEAEAFMQHLADDKRYNEDVWG